METNKRREQVLKTIKNSKEAISATSIAKKFGVSRQIVVGDVALLRASNHKIIATPKGYIMESDTAGNTYTIACNHSVKDTKKELEIIVDCGGIIKDVIVNHAIYGQIVGKLNIESRMDIDEFLNKVKKTKAKNLSELSRGVHLHTITCKNKKTLNIIKERLEEAGLLYVE